MAKPTNDSYRCTASRLLEGIVIGPFSAKGVREDDPNDGINHEERRVLRGLRVFGAFTNYTDLRIENTLDVYVGNEGEGYVKHYFLDFGGSMGAFSADKNRLWEGSNYLFSFKEVTQNLLTAGLVVQEWEELNYTPWKSVGVFEVEKFSPGQWKETYPFLPISQSQPADNYWAAKILGALTGEHLEILVKAAEYPEEGAEEYVLNTLLKRRDKTLHHFLTQVSPVEPVRFSDSSLYLRDMAKLFLGDKINRASYEIRFFDANENKIGEREIPNNLDIEFSIPVPAEYFEKAEGYLCVDVRVYWKDKVAPSAVQFHIMSEEGKSPQLVGVVH